MDRNLLLLLLMIVLGSCVTNVQPLVEKESDAVMDTRFKGHWRSVDERPIDLWVDTVPNTQRANAYRLILYQKAAQDSKEAMYSDTSYLVAQLTKIKQDYFVDITPEPDNWQMHLLGENTVALLMPKHVICKIDIRSDSILYQSIDAEALRNMIKSKEIGLQHFMVDENEIVITEKTDALRRKIAQMAANKKLWSEENCFIRVK